ncbi:hypothetical protein EU527_01180 [Candidatus Thorarchaeota archaeon]|nr:MAG: hypothetical protein EU527_01180 [Candidatus Thorarchaeota archaeon]
MVRPKEIIHASKISILMSGSGYPSWIRLLDDATGVIVISVALVAVLESAFNLTYALEILSIGLLITGLAWVVWGVYIMHSNTYARVFMIVTGISVMILSLVDFILISSPPEFLILFPAAGMILVGLSRLVLGFLIGDIPLWVQMLQVLAGILTLNLAAYVFIFPNVGVPLLLIFLVISFIMNGLVRLIIRRTELLDQCRQGVSATTP